MIVWEKPDGTIAITVVHDAAVPEGESLADFEGMHAAELQANGTIPDDWILRDRGDVQVPTDRTFRAAWTATDVIGVYDVDMPRAKEVKRDMLRAERAALWGALDTAYTRAVESKDDAAAAEIVKRKQALRDITKDPAIDAASTPEELAAVAPEALEREKELAK